MLTATPVLDLNVSSVADPAVSSPADQSHHEKGLSLLSQGRLNEAIAELKHALVEDGSEPLILLNLAIAHMNGKNWPDAGQALSSYLKQRPHDAMAHVRLGVVLHHLKKFSQALHQFQQAVKLNPQCAAAYCHLGDLLSASGHWDQAAAAYQKTLEFKPHYVSAIVGLADLTARRGLPEKAIEIYERALKLSSSAHRGGIYLRMAKVMTGKKNWVGVIRLLNAAIAAGEDAETMNYELAVAYLNLGHRDAAWQQIQILRSTGSRLVDSLIKVWNDTAE